MLQTPLERAAHRLDQTLHAVSEHVIGPLKRGQTPAGSRPATFNENNGGESRH